MKEKFLLLRTVVVGAAAVKHLLQMKLFIKLKLFKNYVKYVFFFWFVCSFVLQNV